MHDSVMRLIACAKISSRNAKNPINNPGRLAEVLGVSSATMTNWKSRGVSKEGALKAEHALGCRPAFILDGQGDPFSEMPALPEGMTPLASLAHPEIWESDMRAAGVAHDLSQARNTESLPRIRWEDLMTADLSRPFELEVIDNALAPEIFPGCIAILDSSRPPEPGWPVLVRDRENNHYLRDYKAGVGRRFGAVPRAGQRDMFDALDSEVHGLKIIASMDGYRRPRPSSSRS